jgi:hypothetical protein
LEIGERSSKKREWFALRRGEREHPSDEAEETPTLGASKADLPYGRSYRVRSEEEGAIVVGRVIANDARLYARRGGRGR